MPRDIELRPESPATTLTVKRKKVKPPKPPRPKKKDLVPDTFLMEGFFPAGTETSVRYTTDFPVGNEETVLYTHLTDQTQEQAAAAIVPTLDAGTYVSASAVNNEVTLAPEGGAATVTVVEVLVTNPPEEPPDDDDSDTGGAIGGDPAIIQITGYYEAGTIIEMDYTTGGGTTTVDYTVPLTGTGLQITSGFANFIDSMPDLVADDVDDFIYIWPELPATSVTLLSFRVIPPAGSGGGTGGETGASYAITVQSDFTADHIVEHVLTRTGLLADVVNVNSLMQNVLTIIADVYEDVEITDSHELTRQLVADLLDSTQVYALVKTASDLAQGWVMNTEGAQPISEYNNFEFNSLTSFKGEFYGTSDTGFYRMGGDTDAGTGITAEIASLMLDLGSSRMKRIRSAYLGYTADNEIVLKVRSVSDGQLFEHWYKAKPVASAEAPRAGYVTVGQGMRSRYWQFELTNVDGGDFEIDQLELYPLFLNRRV